MSQQLRGKKLNLSSYWGKATLNKISIKNLIFQSNFYFSKQPVT